MKSMENKPVFFKDDSGKTWKGVFLGIVRCDNQVDKALVKLKCGSSSDGTLMKVELESVQIMTDAEADIIDFVSDYCCFGSGFKIEDIVEVIEDAIDSINENEIEGKFNTIVDNVEKKVNSIKNKVGIESSDFIDSLFKHVRGYGRDKDGGGS